MSWSTYGKSRSQSALRGSLSGDERKSAVLRRWLEITPALAKGEKNMSEWYSALYKMSALGFRDWSKEADTFRQMGEEDLAEVIESSYKFNTGEGIRLSKKVSALADDDSFPEKAMDELFESEGWSKNYEAVAYNWRDSGISSFGFAVCDKDQLSKGVKQVSYVGVVVPDGSGGFEAIVTNTGLDKKKALRDFAVKMTENGAKLSLPTYKIEDDEASPTANMDDVAGEEIESALRVYGLLSESDSLILDDISRDLSHENSGDLTIEFYVNNALGHKAFRGTAVVSLFEDSNGWRVEDGNMRFYKSQQ